MIVRLLTDGQYRVSEDVVKRLNGLDDQATAALDRDDEDELGRRLEEMWSLVRDQGERLLEEEIAPSDVIIPPADLTLEETRQLFHGDGLIPDIPAP